MDTEEKERIHQALVTTAVEMYEQGAAIGAICQELGRSTTTIYQLLREGGVEPKRRAEAVSVNIVDVLPPEMINAIVADYKANLSVARIMRVHDLTLYTLYKILDETKTPLRRAEDYSGIVRMRLDHAVQMYKDGAKIIQIEVETGIQSTQLYKELYKQGISLRRDIP